MKRLVAMMVAAGAALTAAAMPTKKELQKAQEMVADVTEADVKALKSGAQKPAEVAAKHMELAAQAGSEAEKFLLLQGAFKLYAKAGDYEGAAEALGTMSREIADMNPEVIVDIYNKAIFRSMKEKAPKLHAIKEAARRQVTYRKLLAKAEAAVKTNPKDAAAQKKLGECRAELGDWPKALDAFALAGGTLAKTAKAELDGTAAPQVSGDFWWDYENGDEMSTYKLHAAELYRTALADDSFKGLARTRADQRVKEAEALGIDLLRMRLRTVAGVSSVPLDTFKPKPGSPFQIRGNEATLDLGKGYGKLEFVKCPAGPLNFFLCKQPKEIVKTTISRPFWIMKRPIMRKELQRVLKTEHDSEDYAAIKGDATFEVVKKFNAIFGKEIPSGMVIRLPSLAEFQYSYLADPADTTEQNDVVSNYAARRSCFQRDKKSEPNAWGLYDFNGERMCDLFTKDAVEPQGDWAWDDAKPHLWRKFKQLDSTVDPFYYGEGQIVRNVQFIPKDPGGWMAQCSSGWALNFRLVIGPDLVSEWRARRSNSAGKKTNGGSSIAPAKGADVASAKPMTLELAKGINLELMPCPAGEFDMGRGGLKDVKGLYPHRVKISRPFWLSKNRVTIEQYETFKKATRIRENKGPALEVLGGEKCPIMLLSRDEIDLFFRRLNRKYASSVPRGYVFRLPTEAEWEYAHKANSTDPDDPYVYKGRQYEKFCKAHPEKTPGWHWGEIEPLLKAKGIKENEYTIAPKVGTRPANKWGIQDMNDCGYELMLDTIDVSIDAPKWHWHLLNVDNKCFAYQPFETDPLRQFAGESARSVTWGRFNGVELLRRPWGEPKHEAVSVALRVCLGPDLIAEKKAKGK